MARASFGELSNQVVLCYAGKNLVIRFELDRAGFRKIAMSGEMRAATTAVVRDKALPYAISISPYDPKSKKKHYRDSFVIRQSSIVVADLKRVATRLFNTSDHAVEVEWINGSRVLGKTISYLLHESILEDIVRQVEAGQRRKKFAEKQQPRGKGGRFVPKRSTQMPQQPES